MKYSLDCEFIDTDACSTLISLALVREDGQNRYFEFDYPKEALTPWLRQHVVPHLHGETCTMQEAATAIKDFVGANSKPEIWCYYGAYDWYWFCRVFGGFMNMPKRWPHRYFELADHQQGIPNNHGPEHHALNDALSQLDVMRRHGIVL